MGINRSLLCTTRALKGLPISTTLAIDSVAAETQQEHAESNAKTAPLVLRLMPAKGMGLISECTPAFPQPKDPPPGKDQFVGA